MPLRFVGYSLEPSLVYLMLFQLLKIKYSNFRRAKFQIRNKANIENKITVYQRSTELKGYVFSYARINYKAFCN